jgi:hypothetical protein
MTLRSLTGPWYVGKMTRSLILLLAGMSALALAAATPPVGLAQAQPGLWEVSGVPGSAYPLRQCIADVAVLARFEHRAKACSAQTLREAGNSAQIDYSCGPAGFGHSDVTLVTPRSLRIGTQGISDGLPFNYVIQARRIADCAPLPRH